MISLLATLFFAVAVNDPANLALSNEHFISENADAKEFIASCRTMIPSDVELKGRIILRNRRGIVQSENTYRLMRENGKTSLWLNGESFTTPNEKDFTKPLCSTDVTWSDLALDYLNWGDVSFDPSKESETVHGQLCTIIKLKKDNRTVRVWVDRKTGAMMQAEELAGEKILRRLWGTRIKKFGERWVPNVLEVETLGSGHRTKITVEELK